MTAPLVIFGYKRHDAVKRLLHSLEANPEFRQSRVYAFVDGPRNQSDQVGISEVIRTFEALRHPQLTLVARTTNMGLRKSIISGVSEIMDRHGTAIILEDDLVLSAHALAYFNAALAKYADVPRVGTVTSHTFVSAHLEGRRDAFFLPSPHPWGWATWRDRWRQVDWSPKIDPAQFRSRSFRAGINAYGLRDYARMLKLAEEGLVSSWFIYWCYDSYRRGQLTLYPPVSYSRNEGVSSAAGTHASRLNPYDRLVPTPRLATFHCGLPNEVQVDHHALDAATTSRESRVLRTVSRLGEANRRIRRGFVTGK